MSFDTNTGLSVSIKAGILSFWHVGSSTSPAEIRGLWAHRLLPQSLCYLEAPASLVLLWGESCYFLLEHCISGWHWISLHALTYSSPCHHHDNLRGSQHQNQLLPTKHMWNSEGILSHIRKGNIFKPPLHPSALVHGGEQILLPTTWRLLYLFLRIWWAWDQSLRYISLVSTVITVKSDLYIYRPYCWFHLLRMI